MFQLKRALASITLVLTLCGASSIASAATIGTIGGPTAIGTVGGTSYDHDAYVTHGSKWGDIGLGTPGGTVSYSYVPTGTGCGALCGGSGSVGHLGLAMPTGFEAAIETAFAVWEAIANIHFVEVTDDGATLGTSGSFGDIRLSLVNIDNAGGTLALGHYPPPNSGSSLDGDILFDIAENWTLGTSGGGFDIFTVAAHEIGHAIGLKHEETALALMNPYYNPSLGGLTADDIAGAQAIYGAAVVPLPAAFSLMGFALFLTAAFGRRRKEHSA
ncbi:matrixin family metalloprotease [Puniceibacterium sp. IMCC21224]|uniref:matrixin family metalloprotease n=1 Tax=Puniceibacterium sp. IMCC21224 TaxID=1618204 RepID=UPI00065DAA87|nr:matrixin family metalloprotease [Puniceibacterium sp. IMCC21224]KMK65374.1 Matrixin [Puniceibacterium sp. IMCC21224]